MGKVNASQRAVLIDLDGTMIDTAPDIYAAVIRMLADLHAGELPYQTVRDFIGHGVPNLVRQVCAAKGLADVTEEQACALFYRHYAETNGHFGSVFPGVREGLIAFTQAGYKLGCITNKPHGLAQSLLQIAGLDSYFEIVVGGDSLPTMKPAPEPLLHACTVLGTLAVNTIMVGDSGVDCAAGRAAGIPVYVVRYGYPGPAGLQSLDCDGLIDSLSELAVQLAQADTSEHPMQMAR